jgi:hypothetical protein
VSFAILTGRTEGRSSGRVTSLKTFGAQPTQLPNLADGRKPDVTKSVVKTQEVLLTARKVEIMILGKLESMDKLISSFLNI